MPSKLEQSKLEQLINALQVMNKPQNEVLDGFISILIKNNADPKKRAKLENNDNRISGYILSIFTVLSEEILNDPDNPKYQAFLNLGKKLKTTKITRDDTPVLDRLSEAEKPRQKLGPRGKGG